MTYKMPDLSYDFGALEPVISGKIMEIHYTKHHQTYVNNLNIAVEKYAELEKNHQIEAMIPLQQAIKFNGGGHINHSIFWKNLAPVSQGGGGVPQGALLAAINEAFGSFDQFKEKMTQMTVAIQGSGWGWLGYDKAKKELLLTTCANQDPLSTQGYTPLLGIDVWEHAYYLQYMNVRADYVKNIWNIINWNDVSQRFETHQAP
ncbi:superoxide dismutase [Rhabdochlamydiaceae symbiont of Dictyostelium giganteum]|uniref:superoxide dismutase n=1 Tax=Rhabdochlamydiaceae symbiont of Dictyostelium giganteum TaxID=3342349 RepID=UPI0038511F50